MAAHPSRLAWRIPWTEEPGRLQSTGRRESDRTKRLSTRAHCLLSSTLCTRKRRPGSDSDPSEEGCPGARARLRLASPPAPHCPQVS